MNSFSPLMLTLARESRKMSQGALASAACITQSAVSQMEAGIIRPSDEVAQRMADVLKCMSSLFYASAQFHQLPLTFFRKKASVGARDVSAIRARVNLYRLRIETLLRSYEIESPKIALADLVAEGITAAEAAQRIRIYWNVAPGPIRDLTGLVESAGIMVVPMDFGTAAVDGISIYEPNDVLPPIIFLSDRLPPDRWRLTLAHELGHIVMHHHLRTTPPSQDVETEAFDFAAELLAPARDIEGHLARLDMHRLAALKVYWRISMAALVMRAKKLGRLPAAQERSLWIKLGRGGQKEPVELTETERPSLLRSAINYHLEKLGYSIRGLSGILHLSPEEFRAEFGLNPAPLRLSR